MNHPYRTPSHVPPIDIELDDDSVIVKRDISITIRSFDEKKRTCDFVASTAAIDAYDEIVEQDWILDDFRTNPVILFGHQSRDLPIGKGLRCEVVSDIQGPRLECTVQFAEEKHNPKAEQVFQQVKDEFLRAVSVGFRPRSVRYEKRNGKDVYVLSQNVLKEISVVTIPANPEALAKGAPDPLATAKARAKALAENQPDSTEPVFGQEGVVGRTITTNAERATASGTKDHSMDPIALQAALDAKTGELAVSNQKAADLETRLKTAEAAVTTANDMARAYEDRAKKAEETVTVLEGTVAGIGGAIEKTFSILGRKHVVDEKGEPAKNEKGEPVLENIVEAAERVVGEIVSRDVEALIPSKIDPAQKADYVALAKKDRPLFESIVKGLPERKVLGQIVPAAKTERSAPAVGDNGEGFAALLGDGESQKDDGEPADLSELLDD